MMTLVPQERLTTEVSETTAPRMDRRRGMRVQNRRPVRLYEPLANQYIPGWTRNIGSAGLCIELPTFTKVRPGRVITLHVGVSMTGHPLANRRSMIPARVVWTRIEQDEQGEQLIVGVEFLASITAESNAA